MSNIFSLSYFEYIFIFHCATALFICVFIYIKNKKETANVIFSFYSFCVFIWSFGFFMLIRAGDLEGALFWRWFMESGSVLLPALWLHFVYALVEANGKSKKTIKTAYIVSVILWFLNLSDLFGLNLFASSIDSKNLFAFYPTAGIGYGLFLVFYLIVVVYSLSKLFNYYLNYNISKFKRKQIKYVFFAALLGFSGGGMTFLLTFNINILPYGVILSAIYPMIITYAITKYNLLGIRVFAAYFLIIVLNLISFMHIFLSKNIAEYIIETLTFTLVLTTSYLLKKSFEKEIKQKESLQKATQSLQKANKKIEANNQKLKSLDKAKNEFLSVAAHQLRTPATAIKGYTSMVLEGTFGKCDKRALEAIDKVYTANERMTNLIEDLLTTSRIESGYLKYEFEKTDIQEILENLKNDFVIRAEESGLKFSVKYPKKEPLPEIIADKKKITEVISNIIDNALKYTPEGSVKVVAEREDNFIKISVKDTGRGLTEKTKGNLFEKFTRGKESASDVEGTGLGLFVVKNYVEKHGGTITALSEGLGKGSEFVVMLPVKRAIEKEDEL